MNIPNILVADCNSENCLSGLKYAAQLAQLLNAKLTIFHVRTPDQSDYKSRIDSPVMSDYKLPYEPEEIFSDGIIVNEILKISAEKEPALIVMTPDISQIGLKTIEESITAKLIKLSFYPVLIIPPMTDFREIRKILIMSDQNDRIFGLVNTVLKLFNTISPEIHFEVMSGENNEWNQTQEIQSMTSGIKNFTEYNKISGIISRSTVSDFSKEIYANESGYEIICLDRESELFQKAFWHRQEGNLTLLMHKPLLVFPGAER